MDCPEYIWKITSWHRASIDRSHFHVHMVRVASRSAIAFIEFVSKHLIAQCFAVLAKATPICSLRMHFL